MKLFKNDPEIRELIERLKLDIAEMLRDKQVLEEQNAGLRARMAELASENWKLRTNGQTKSKTAGEFYNGVPIPREVNPTLQGPNILPAFTQWKEEQRQRWIDANFESTPHYEGNDYIVEARGEFPQPVSDD